MSGGDKAPQPTDQQRIDTQVNATDALAQASNLMHDTFGLGRVRVLQFGRVTDFENHQLNDMIDLVHHASPADLEHAGDALGKASKAITEAAAELRRHLKHASEDWKGVAGEAFETWGTQLAAHTEHLATYADNAGVQIAAAAMGLASVRSSMPPRDTRAPADQKKPGQLPSPAQVAGNKDYAEAVRVEKDRQEAINQMNRLASFYSVSGEQLAKLEPPVFEAMPEVGMPPPIKDPRQGNTGAAVGNTHSDSARPAVTSVEGRSHVTVSRDHSGHNLLPSQHPAADLDVQPNHPSVGTEINSVDTLPQESAKPMPVASPSTPTAPNGPSTGTLPPLGTGALPPAFGGPVGRAVGLGGTAGGRAPGSVQGRATAPEGTPASGRGGRGLAEPVGRASAVGQQGGRQAVSSTGRPPIGRGVTGGMPRAAGMEGPRARGASSGRVSDLAGQPAPRTGPGATGAARTGGVVGGRPTAEAGPGTSTGIPRGTVIGGEGSPGARPTGETPGRRGVIGANNPVTGTQQGRPPRGLPSSPDGVVGAPAARAGAKGNEATSGGSGLVRRSMGERSPHDASAPGARRQQHSAEGKKRSRDDSERSDAPSATD